MSETITAALSLLAEKRKADEVVGKLKPNELELVIEVVQNSCSRARTSHCAHVWAVDDSHPRALGECGSCRIREENGRSWPPC